MCGGRSRCRFKRPVRDAVPLFDANPGVGNAGLFSDGPFGTCGGANRKLVLIQTNRVRDETKISLIDSGPHGPGPGRTADNSPPVPLAGMRDPRDNRGPGGTPEQNQRPQLHRFPTAHTTNDPACRWNWIQGSGNISPIPILFRDPFLVVFGG